MTCTNYATAIALLTGRCKDRRKIANNTYLERRPVPDSHDNIAVRLHNTDVVTYLPNGDAILNSGGWLTATTKDRMTTFAPCSVSQTDGAWSVRYGPTFAEGNRRWDMGETFPYRDGMTLHADGSVSGTLEPWEVAEIDKRVNRQRREIRKFIKSITANDIVQAFENSGGDCLLCRFDSVDCLTSHVEEHYFHATLAHRAITAAGYPNPDLIMSMVYGAAQREKVDTMLTRALGKFLRANLIVGRATR